MKKKYVFIILISMFLMLISITGTVSAANHTVNPGDSIQSVINNASSNDTIIVNDNNGSAYTYTGNLIINKTLQLKASTGKNVTIRPSNLSSIVTVNPGVTVTISNLIFANGNYASGPGGAIYNRGNLTLINCTFRNNTAYWGGAICNDGNLTVTGSTFMGNTAIHDGGAINSNNVLNVNNCVFTNNVAQHVCGAIINWQGTMNVTGSGFTGNTAAMEGSTIGNYYGSANINFNRIVVSGNYGLYNANGGVVNATNNWWGSNTDPTTNSSNIRNNGGTVTYNPWLVLNLTANPTRTNGNSTVTADLTHNSNGADTSSGGHVPDNIPVNFTTTLGNMASPVYTRNGKAILTFNSGTVTSGVASVTATLDGQILQMNITIDAIAPTVNATLAGGVYNTTKNVTLTASDNLDSNPVVYYSLNNGSTWNSQVKTVTLNLSQGVISLKFYARDNAGNVCLNQTVSYTIDLTAPTVTANLVSGTYNTTQVVTLIASDNLDSNPSIYYTTNGANPITSSTKYTNPITIASNTILKFMAVDKAGNQAGVQSRNYSINLPIVNVNTSKVYSSIQAAINDTLTLNGHVIELKSGNYMENIIVNKKLTVRQVSGGNVILQALNSSKPVFTVNAGGSGTVIQGFVINGATNSSGVYLVGVSNCSIIGNNLTGNLYGVTIYNSSNNAVKNNNASGNNCGIFVSTNSNSNLIQNNTVNNNRDDGIFVFNGSNNNIIQNNSLAGNQYAGILINYNANTSTIKNSFIQNNMLTGNYHGIYLSSGSSNSTVQNNIVTNSTYEGVYIFAGSINNIVQNNNLTNNQYGISLYNNSNNTIYRNSIISNQYGIYLSNSSANINFNQITGNTKYGLYKVGNGTINATNNWWGINSPQISSTYGSALYMPGGGVNSTLWLMLNLTGSVIHVTKNSTSSSEITADLTHNNHGEDTSSSGALPEGIPVNFTATLPATIISSTTTRRGKAVVTLTSSTNSSATNITATADNQTVSRAFRKSFSSIQAAVNDPLTLTGDIIIVGNGTYVENIVINKNLTIISEGNVTVQALIHSVSVLTINSGGSGSWIQGFTISGANSPSSFEFLSPAGILLASTNNCTVLDNVIKNNVYGIYLLDSSYNEIIGNIIENNEQGIIIPNACESLEGWLSINCNPEGEELIYYINQYYQYFFGIGSNSIFNNITDNKIRNNTYHGIYSTGELSSLGYNQLISNDITGNAIGIFCGESAVIKAHFNRIAGNNLTGFCMAVGNTNTDVSNNWWGSNNPTMILNSTGNYINADFCYIGRYPGTEYYQWLPSNWILEKFAPIIVLNIRPTSYKVSNGKCDESIITADLNYNLYGECISSKGHVPDGIPIYFNTDKGTITNIGYTKKGTSSSNLVLNPNLQSGITNVTVTLDNQNVSTQVDRVAKAIITISSSAIDNSTGRSLNFTYEIHLNESVSWVSVLWEKNAFNQFTEDVHLIINGQIVTTRTVINRAYLENYNKYGGLIFYDINDINWMLSDSEQSRAQLGFMLNMTNSQLQNYTKSQLGELIISHLNSTRHYNTTELSFIRNYELFKDDITVSMFYPGDEGKKITIVDPDTNNTTQLNFPGSHILRISDLIYHNGDYMYDKDNITYWYTGYEGVRSFSIATTKVTDEILRYWLDQKDNYNLTTFYSGNYTNGTFFFGVGPMKAAYGTFLTALLVQYCTDKTADGAAAKYNVTWSRTTPIVMSAVDDANYCYLTGEMDHRMGMDVTGDPNNVKSFRSAVSSAFSPIEYWVFNALGFGGDPRGSVTLGFGDMLRDGEPLTIFECNGYTIIKGIDNNNFIVIDPETGIVRDCGLINASLNICGAYCFNEPQTELASDYGNSLLNNTEAIDRAMETGEAVATDFGQDDVQDEVLGIASSVTISVGVALLIATGPPGWLALGLIGLGMAGCFFAADLDENPLSTSNWMKFGLMVGPSLIPVYGAEAAIGSKIGWNALKTSLPTYTRKGLMSSAPVGTNLVGSIKNVLGQTYTTITQSLTNKEVIRLTCGDSVKSSLVNGLSNTPISLTDRTCVVIDEYSEEIDRWVSARYNSFEDYILQGPASLIP